MNKKKALIIFLFVLLFFSFVKSSVWAGGINCPQEGLVPCGTEDCPCELCDLFIMIDRIIDFLLFSVAPMIAVVMIAIGGFMMITAYTGSAGPEAINKAKKLFASIAIGLLIIYGAWAIVSLFLTTLGVAEWAGFKNGAWEIICD